MVPALSIGLALSLVAVLTYVLLGTNTDARMDRSPSRLEDRDDQTREIRRVMP